MKKLLVLICLLPWLASGQTIRPNVITTNGSLTTARTASSAVGVLQMSPVNGGNYLSDMQAATSTFDGQLGISYGGDRNRAMWAAQGIGTGQSVWGGSFFFPGGIQMIGSDIFDVTNNSMTNGNMYIEFNGGPTGSKRTNIDNGNGNIRDTYLYVDNNNPWDSGASLGLRSADTNGFNPWIGGSPFFTNGDGVVLHKPQFGFDMIDIPFSYPIGVTNQAGSDVLIYSKPYFGVSVNATYGGTLGQYPNLWIDNRYQSNGTVQFMAGFPGHVDNVFVPHQAGWLWDLGVDEINHIVYLTNGPSVIKNIQTLTSAALNGGSLATIALDFGQTLSGSLGGASGFEPEITPNGGAAAVLFECLNAHPVTGIVPAGQSWSGVASGVIGGNELEDFRTWGHAMWDIHGNIATAIQAYSSSQVIANATAASVTNSTILLNGTTNVVTLPDAAFNAANGQSKVEGRIYTIKEITNSSAQVWVGVAGQKIDGLTNYYLGNNEAVTVQSDGTNWQIISDRAPMIQAGETNLSAASSVIVQYKMNMPDTNYNVHLTGDSATLAAPVVTAQTVSNFSASMTSFTGGFNWTIIERTQ